MLLQALGEFANSQLEHQLDDVAFTAKRVSYLIEISRGGSFLGVTDCHQPARLVRPAPRLGTLMLVPRSPLHRTGGLCPLLACDNIHYVLEAGDKQNAFIDLLRDAAAATYDPALWSCVGFYRNRAEVECARQALLALDMPDGAVIGLSVGGPVVSRPAVREYWRAHYQRAVAARLEGGRAGNWGLASGTVGLDRADARQDASRDGDRRACPPAMLWFLAAARPSGPIAGRRAPTVPSHPIALLLTR